jgi:hypothetical protein
MDMQKQHEDLIDKILSEEEDLTKIHKNMIDSEMDIVRDEMRLLVDV